MMLVSITIVLATILSVLLKAIIILTIGAAVTPTPTPTPTMTAAVATLSTTMVLMPQNGSKKLQVFLLLQRRPMAKAKNQQPKTM